MDRDPNNGSGTLYLLPVPLGPTLPEVVLPQSSIETTRRLSHFVVENAKTARAILKALNHPLPMREIHISELNEHTKSVDIGFLLQPLREGRHVGLMSEAGCPAIADPGAQLVEIAHRENIRVIPVVGPSSILLALMASGMNGQRFTFNGYLPASDPERTVALRKLEGTSAQEKSVQIFIETPYRNIAMLESLLHLKSETRLCIACDLTLTSELIQSACISDWRNRKSLPAIDRRPSVFLLQAK